MDAKEPHLVVKEMVVPLRGNQIIHFGSTSHIVRALMHKANGQTAWPCVHAVSINTPKKYIIPKQNEQVKHYKYTYT